MQKCLVEEYNPTDVIRKFTEYFLNQQHSVNDSIFFFSKLKKNGMIEDDFSFPQFEEDVERDL